MGGDDDVIDFPERPNGIRVGDLRSWHYVQVTCWFCGHTGRLHAQSLWRRCRMDDSLVYVMKRVRCRNCGGAGGAKWEIWQIDLRSGRKGTWLACPVLDSTAAI
ncbi:MAG: hypothetical protein ACR2RF_24510 [Geminicoccaceae bacterium]